MASQSKVDLDNALRECRLAARQGYNMAKENLSAMEYDINYISSLIFEGLNDLGRSRIRTKEVDDNLQMQLYSKIAELKQYLAQSESDLERRHKSLDKFSVTLFGRTMAGKSTLMEILTEGNGASIGKGSQRTTRDVRSYQWNGLEITDVPGIAAFERQEDEKTAFESAQKADLILFLITDDAPQPVEAECLARIMKLGKPVIGVCNVKIAVDDPNDMKIFLRKPDKIFDDARLTQIYRQINQLLGEYMCAGHLQFMPTHLRARYLSGLKDYSDKKSILIDISRFNSIEDRIVQIVKSKGIFFRIKSFVECSVVPTLRMLDKLLEFGDQNFSSSRVLQGKKRELINFTEEFRRSSRERVDVFVSRIGEQLRSRVPGFVESHCQLPLTKVRSLWV